MKVALAYSFKCDRPLPELRGVLEETLPWIWRIRESAVRGAYLIAKPACARLRIFGEGDRYVLEVTYRSDTRDAEGGWESLHETLVRRLLPGMGAREVAVS